MGHGSYSHTSRSLRSESLGYHEKSNDQIFESRKCTEEMSPLNLQVRESRDSDEHPNSVPIIIGLDVTGSMGSLPQHIVRDGLPNIIAKLQEAGIADPQILFLGVGDHVFDSAPIQVSQFESSDELLDKWLTQVYLEGGGGNNVGESYILGWLIGAKYTVTDSMVKRNQKGFLFTIGDEPLLSNIDQKSLNKIFGEGYQNSMSLKEVHAMASEKYHIVHFHTDETGSGQRFRKGSSKWDEVKELLGQDLVFINSVDELSQQIADVVSQRVGASPVAESGDNKPEAEETPVEEEPML